MMNKVARYRGISRNRIFTMEPGSIYMTEDGVVIVDELKKVHEFQTRESISEEGNAVTGGISSIEARLALLEGKVDALRKTNVEPVAAEKGISISASDASKDYVVAGETDKTVNLTAKSVEMKNMSVELEANAPLTSNNAVFINATEDVDIKGSSLSMDKDKNANLVKVVEAETLVIRDTVFSGTTYNTIMTGQNSTSFLKSMIVDNCDFNEDCKHINIWFGGFADNATLTISNCHFRGGEQFLCISDYAGYSNHLTVNLVNCVIDSYEKDGTKYEGIMLLDARTCPAGAFESNNPFGDGKVIINISNVTVAGVKLNEGNFIMGNGGDGQMLYVYKAKDKANVAYSEETAHLFPTVNFR